MLLVERGLTSKKVKTFPLRWRLPEFIRGKLVELLYAIFDSWRGRPM
jgi:hypothetical protein